LLNKFQLDDPVGAIPVHGAAGFWGTIAVGIFGEENLVRSYLGLGMEDSWQRMDQIVSQLMGAGIVIVFTVVASFIFFKIIEVTIGLRVDPDKENSGYIFISND